MSRIRLVDTLRLGLGLGALARPDLVLRLSRTDDSTAVHRAVRLLGARYVVQSAGGIALGRPWMPGADAAVDLVHAASMLGVAAFTPAYRRLALLSAVAAMTFAGADLTEHGR